MQSVDFVFSPNQKFKVAFSHFQEIRMGSYEGLFTLLDNNDCIIDLFEPITAINSNLCCWTENSIYFALSVRHFISGYFIVRLPELDFAFIKMINPYPIDISFEGDKFIISYNNNQVALSNSTQTFGGGTLEIPSKKYIKPKDLNFDLKNLIFYSRQQLNDLVKLTKAHKEYNLELIDAGFNEFKGVFPKNTKQVYNTRQLEIYQLETFAEYGDKKSQEWLELIKQKTNNNYNKWTKVSEYIGFHER